MDAAGAKVGVGATVGTAVGAGVAVGVGDGTAAASTVAAAATVGVAARAAAVGCAAESCPHAAAASKTSGKIKNRAAALNIWRKTSENRYAPPVDDRQSIAIAPRGVKPPPRLEIGESPFT